MASYFPRTWEDAAHLNFTTDELGHCAVPVSDREFEILRIWISAPGHVPKVIDWRKYEFQAQPEEYVVRLEPGGVIGGVVKDEADQPVSQAKLRVSGAGRVSSQRENIGYRDESSSVFSDDHGHWRFDQVPMGLDTLKFFVTHPDYAKAMVFLPLAPPGFTNHVVVIKRGVEVWGTVSKEPTTHYPPPRPPGQGPGDSAAPCPRRQGARSVRETASPGKTAFPPRPA